MSRSGEAVVLSQRPVGRARGNRVLGALRQLRRVARTFTDPNYIGGRCGFRQHGAIDSALSPALNALVPAC